jgi:hypothetical protein
MVLKSPQVIQLQSVLLKNNDRIELFILLLLYCFKKKKTDVITRTVTLFRYFRFSSMNTLESENDRHAEQLAAKVSRLKNVSKKESSISRKYFLSFQDCNRY